jgi:uncharacterized protein (TIGR02284 family)
MIWCDRGASLPFITVARIYAGRAFASDGVDKPQEMTLDADILDQLKSLHTSATYARNGYREALKDAEGKGMTPLFREMIGLHESNAAELARELTKANEIPDEDGSFMSVVHETIMDVRSLFNGLDEGVLPGLIDGEKRNLSKYDHALKVAGPASVASLLTAQRGKIAQKIALMETQKVAFDRVSP